MVYPVPEDASARTARPPKPNFSGSVRFSALAVISSAMDNTAQAERARDAAPKRPRSFPPNPAPSRLQ